MPWSDVILISVVLLTTPLWGPIVIYAAFFVCAGLGMLIWVAWLLLIGLIEGIMEMWKKQTGGGK